MGRCLSEGWTAADHHRLRSNDPMWVGDEPALGLVHGLVSVRVRD